MEPGGSKYRRDMVGISQVQLTLLHPRQRDGHGLRKFKVVKPEDRQEGCKILKRSPTV